MRIKISSPAIVAALFLVLGVLIYSNSFYSQYVFDDVPFIKENYELRNFPGYFSHWKSDQRFFTNLTFAFNYAFGENLLGFHLVNLLIHISNSLLVYIFVLLIFQTPRMTLFSDLQAVRRMALGAGLVFLTHPVQTQAVTFLWQRATSLGSFFYILTLVLYLYARLHKRARNYGFVIISAVIAQRSKGTAMTLPLMIASVEWIFFGFSRLNFWKYGVLTGLLILVALIGPLSIAQGNWRTFFSIDKLYRPQIFATRYQYMLTELNAFVTYLRLLIFPVGQNLLYDYPIAKSIFEPKVIGAVTVLVSLIVLGFVALRKNRFMAFGIFWFFIILSIELGPIRAPIYEHRLYPAMVGWGIVVSSFLVKMFRDPKKYILALCVLTAVYSVATYRRNEVWRNPITLWEDVVKKSPHEMLALNNLGISYLEAGKKSEAGQLFEKNVRLHPEAELPYTNLGAYYLKMGEPEKAVDSLKKAIELNPASYRAWYNLGDAYMKSLRLKWAIGCYQKALAIYDALPDAHYALANAYATARRPSLAAFHYKKVLSLKPDHKGASDNLGRLLKAYGSDSM